MTKHEWEGGGDRICDIAVYFQVKGLPSLVLVESADFVYAHSILTSRKKFHTSENSTFYSER